MRLRGTARIIKDVDNHADIDSDIALAEGGRLKCKGSRSRGRGSSNKAGSRKEESRD